MSEIKQLTLRRSEGIVEQLETILEKAKRGEISNFLCSYEEESKYHYVRVNLTFEFAMGMLARHMHVLNEEWSNPK